MKLLVGVLSCVVACSSPTDALAQSVPQPKPAVRTVKFNATPLDARGFQALAQLEAHARITLPDGDYWYDPRSGASGPWGGGVFLLLPANLPLGGPLRPESSGGGKGQLTGVFVNGRELHPNDTAALGRLFQVIPGRYWVDAQGNVGHEGSSVLFNVYALAKQQSKSHTSKWAPGETWTGGGAATSTWGSDSGRIKNHCSYDPSDGAGVMCSKTGN